MSTQLLRAACKVIHALHDVSKQTTTFTVASHKEYKRSHALGKHCCRYKAARRVFTLQ